MNWCLLNYIEGQTCFVNWTAAQTISNTLLAIVLIGITAYYAIQTHSQVKAMQNQVTSMQDQVRVMQDQLSFERTFRPRLDAYKNFMEIMSSNVNDTRYIRYTIHGGLRSIQPFASSDVKSVAKTIYESTITENRVIIPTGFVDRINTELIPKIENEVAEITRRN